MSEHDVPAERGRDELREKIEYALERCTHYGYRSVGVGLTADDARRILALLAPQGARADDPCTDPFHFHLDGPTGAQQCPRCGSRMKVAPASGEPSSADAAVREAHIPQWLEVWRRERDYTRLMTVARMGRA